MGRFDRRGRLLKTSLRHAGEVLSRGSGHLNGKISAKLADDNLAPILHAKPGDSFLLRKRVVCDLGDRLIECNLGYYRADSFAFHLRD